MKKHLLLSLIVTFLFAVSSSVFSQEKKMKNGDAKKAQGKAAIEDLAFKQASRLEKKLGLNMDQKKQVQSLVFNRLKRMEEIKAKYKGQGDENKDRGDALKAARKEFVDGVNAVLSPEQQTNWKQHREEVRKKMKAKKGDKSEGKEKKAESMMDENEDVDLD